MNMESSPFGNNDKKNDKLRANFNEQTNSREKIDVLDNIFCKECKTPVFSKTESTCAKCGRDFSESVGKAKALQEKLRKESERNQRYTPPELYI